MHNLQGELLKSSTACRNSMSRLLPSSWLFVSADCAMILQDFMVATHSVVPCGHMFCGECLSEWLQKNPTCPKCRAAATAPPVRTMAVDNVLESVVEKGMSKEELQERKQRKQHWDAHAAVINSNMKHLFRHGGNRPPHGFPAPFGQQGHSAALNWEALAAMQQG